MILNRPCGECAKLVPSDTGCPHWRPGKQARPVKRRSTRGGGTVPDPAALSESTGRQYR